MRPCDYIDLKHPTIHCVAMARDGDRYCAVHSSPTSRQADKPTSRQADKPTRNYDADLLPLTDEEFRALAELRTRTK